MARVRPNSSASDSLSFGLALIFSLCACVWLMGLGLSNGFWNNDTIASTVVKSFQGTESVKSEGQANNLTVGDELATKTKNKFDLVSPEDSKVNKDDANDTKKKQPEKTDNDEKPKERWLGLRAQTLLKELMQVEGNYDNDDHNGNNDHNGNSGNSGNSGNDGGYGGGCGGEKKKEENEGNGGGKMKFSAGQSGFRLSNVKVHRHGYGYQNGEFKTGDKMSVWVLSSAY